MRRVEKRHQTPEELEYRAQTFQAVGVLLLVVDALVATFIFVGFRNGSYLWLYWTFIEGAFGMGFIMAGLRTEHFAVEAMGHSVTPHLHAGGNIEDREAA
jgi:protein-S-isoprenylcysteine O-methyltransferase Ste14